MTTENVALPSKFQTPSILKLSWPIFIEIFLQIMVGNVDQIMLSHYSESAVAAVANANQVINILMMLLIVISTATTILIAQYLGARNKEKIAETCTVSLAFNGAFGLFIGLLIVYCKESIFSWLEVPLALRGEAGLYLSIVASGIFINGMHVALVSSFRGLSWTKVTMLVALGMNILHIGVNYAFIFGLGPIPSLGVFGVALSTVGSKLIALGVLLFIFIVYAKVPLSLSYLSPFPWKTLKQLLRLGIPSGGETLSYQLSQAAIMKVINTFGVVVITTKVYVMILAILCYVYAIALSSAAQVVIGYLIGASRKEEVESKGWYATIISVIVCGGISTLFYCFSDSVLGLFTTNPEIITLGKDIMFIDIFLELFRGVNVALVCCLQATGDIKMPTITGIVCMWFIAVGCSYLLGVSWGYGLIGIWIAMGLDEAVRALIFIYRWRSGAWKKYSLL